jgi:predicted P-loop ATPase
LRRADDFEKIIELKGRCVAGIISSDKILTDYVTLVKLGDRLRFNTLKKQVELDGKPVQVGTAKIDLTVNESLLFKTKTEFEGIFVKVAKRNSYSPVVEYLEFVSGENPNIDLKILNNIAERYFGKSEPIYQIMLKRFLIGAVARAYVPGAKNDCALILQGAQGVGKSSFFKVLAGGDEFFDDSLGNPTDKDEKLKLHQHWFTEWAELETVFRRKDIAATKAFLSSSVDNLRPPYGRDTIAMPRCSVIVGTTNQEEFLSDTTGNRRFWVVPVNFVDIELLRSERDRIWAAAVALYKSGEQWWLDSSEDEVAATIAEEFLSSDPWTEPVLDYIDSCNGVVTVKQILDFALKIEVARQDKAAQMRVATILSQAGYKRGSRSRANGRRVIWVKLEPEVIETQEKTPKATHSEVNSESHPDPKTLQSQSEIELAHSEVNSESHATYQIIAQSVKSAGLTIHESKSLRRELFPDRWGKWKSYSEADLDRLRLAIAEAGRQKQLEQSTA